MRIRVIAVLCAFSSFVLSTNAEEPSPEKQIWSTGQKWKVEVESQTQLRYTTREEVENVKPRMFKEIYEFEVESVLDVDGESCALINIQSINYDGVNVEGDFIYKILIRQSDIALKRLERINTLSGKVELTRFCDSIPSADASLLIPGLPLVFPSFEKGLWERVANADGIQDEYSLITEDLRLEKSRKLQVKNYRIMDFSGDGAYSWRKNPEAKKNEYRLIGEYRQREEMIKMRSNNGAMTDHLRFVLEFRDNIGAPCEATQTWLNGSPWWVETNYFIAGKKFCSTKLIVDGVDETSLEDESDSVIPVNDIFWPLVNKDSILRTLE